jgi:hypothetical protein
LPSWRRTAPVALTTLLMFQAVQDVLETFQPITLSEMDSVKLMDRTDTKFVFPVSQLPQILREVKDSYRALVVSGTRLSKYETLYYDTADFDLYHRHHAGRSQRFKVRSRRYVESDLCFFEVKYRNNKGRTIKNRIRTPLIENHISENPARLLGELTNLDPASLKGTIWVNYQRATLVSKTNAERLTLDLGLSYRTAHESIDFSKMVIAEVKREKANSVSPVISVLNDRRIRAGSISKYCLGLISTHAGLRKNNFMEQIRHFQRILNNAA